MMDLCDLTYKLRSHFFPKDRDVVLQTGRILTLGDGTDVTASCFVPVGGVILWSGAIAAIPTNWALCNGANGTPDLRDKFVLAAGGSYAVGATGGAATKDLSHTHADGTLATDAAATHTHGAGSYAADDDTHSHGAGTLDTDPSADNIFASLGGADVNVARATHDHDVVNATANDTHAHDVTGTSGSGGAHAHDVTGSTASGGSATQDVLNPYYALAYIMRTA